MDKYLDFCNKCIQGKIGHKKNFYILDTIEPDRVKKEVDVSMVSPTQAAVEQAKSKMNLQNDINRAEKRKYDQIGGKTSVKKHIKRQKKGGEIIIKSRQRKKISAQRKNSSHPINNKIKKKNSKSYKTIWM